ncbi:transcriptional regulator protein [Methanolapillus ohkumae]|uniref:transcriptional regulator protein n=1 Tax=Methanolapillus ohkumae TaxID=3028298 RepID=UPI0030B89460
MKDYEIKVLDEDDLLFANHLKNLGIQKNVALTLTYLLNVEEASSREIEIGTGLRQPEISLALCYMKSNGWISGRLVKVNRKGRPMHVYSLKVTLEYIFEHYEEIVYNNSQESILKIQRVKDFLKNTEK